MALLLATLNNRRRQTFSTLCVNQQAIVPVQGSMMDIQLDTGNAFEIVDPADLEEDQYLFISTPVVPTLLDDATFRATLHFCIVVVTEAQPTCATTQVVYFTVGNPIMEDLTISIATKITINHPTNFLVLTSDSIDLFVAEREAFDKIIAQRNLAAQELPPAAGLPAAGQPRSGHASTSQVHLTTTLSSIRFLYSHSIITKFVPGTLENGPLMAGAFSQPLMLAHGKASIDKKGVCSDEKIPNLSLKKIENLMLCNFNTQSDGFSLTDFVDPTYLATFPRKEKIQVIGRYLVAFAVENFGQRFATVLTSMFGDLRPVFDFASCFTLPLLLEPIHRKLFSLRLFPIAAHTASCPPATDLDSHITRELQAYLRISRRDDEIEYILMNHRSPSAGGGGDDRPSRSIDTSVGASVGPSRRRKRKETHDTSDSSSNSSDEDTERQPAQTTRRWFLDNPIPGASICWDWACQHGDCAFSPVCARRQTHPHEFPRGTSTSKIAEFISWLDQRPRNV